MKNAGLVTLLVWTGCLQAGWAQVGNRSLNDDPVFQTVLSRQVTYPPRAIREATCGRIYAGFDIDPKGHIQHIAILDADHTGLGFEYEVKAALKRMPPLNPRFTGRYALPVAFVFTNWGESPAPRPSATTTPALYFADRLLLGEVIFRGEWRPDKTYIPPGNQIRYY